ncbi:MAG: hypothetical protein MJ009_06170 [Paludibacteraceae bacterium]|nr:hypothetical protein [Paludibacteraceae bacterium]
MEKQKLLKSLKRRLGLITTILAMLLVSQGAFAAYTWSVVGLGGDWSKDYELKNISGNYYAADISVSATTDFKIRKNQAWTESYGEAQITTSSNFNISNSGGNNAKITISSSGIYKFIWNSSSKKLTVIYPSPQLNIKQSSSSWTQPSLTYNSTTTKYSGQVAISSIYSDGVVQVKNGNNYVGNDGSAKMQRDNCSGWNFTTTSKQTGINFDVPGTYTFNFDPYAGTMSVTYPYVVFGNFDGNGNKAYPLDSDGKATIKITAGNRTFRMATDKWRGCSQCSITRSNCTDIQQYDSDGGDTPINADVTGDYEFTYNLSTCKVTVTYPTVYTAKAQVGSVAGGTVTIDTETASSTSISKTVVSGTAVDFKATKSSGYNFKGWGTTSSATSYESTDNPYNVTISADKTLYAIFESACTTPTAGSIGGTTSICAGNGTTLTLSGQTAGTNLQWYKSTDGSSYSAVSSATGTSLSTGTLNANAYYKVRVSRTDDASCYSETTPVTVTVTQIPSIATHTDGSRCGAGTVTVSATASAGDVKWYSASTGGIALKTGTSYTTPSISTTTKYYVDATQNGCTTASRTAVTATVKTVPSVSNIALTGSGECGAGDVTFTATATQGSTVNWFEGASAAGSGNEKIVNIAAGGSKTLTAKATMDGCTETTGKSATGSRKAVPNLTTTPSGSAVTAYLWEPVNLTATTTDGTATVAISTAATKYEVADITNGKSLKAGNADDTFSVTYTATSPNGCQTQEVKTVTAEKATEFCGN